MAPRMLESRAQKFQFDSSGNVEADYRIQMLTGSALLPDDDVWKEDSYG